MGVSVLTRLTCYPSIKLSTIESRCTPPVRKLSFRSITERMEAGRIVATAIESGHVGQHLEVLDLDYCNLGHTGLATVVTKAVELKGTFHLLRRFVIGCRSLTRPSR